MKRINLLVAMLFMGSAMNAQITLLHESTPYDVVIGDFQKAVTLNLGGDGPNQTWDYSGMVSTPTYQQMMKTENNPTIPHGDLFPNADFVFRTHSLPNISTDTTWMFFKMAQDKYEVIGQFSQYQNELCTYSDYELARPVPFNYLDSLFDEYEMDCPNPTYTINKVGTISTKYDAFGTLILPHGTFNNVGRVKMVKNQTAYSISGPDTLVTTNYILTAYSYFNNSGIGLYTIAYVDVSGSSAGTPFTIPTDTSGTYSTFDMSSLELLEASSLEINFGPNPCVDYLEVENANNYQDYVIVNNLGQIVASDKFNAEGRIDVNQLNPGAYHLILNNGDKLMSKKFIKQSF